MKYAIPLAFVIGFIACEAVAIAFGPKIKAFVVSVLQKLTSKVSG
jgi:hypothetical protein